MSTQSYILWKKIQSYLYRLESIEVVKAAPVLQV